MSFLVEDLIESVKDRSFAPISQNTFEDAGLLRILNEELKLKLAADLLRAREDFFIWRKTVPIVANKDLYPIPNRAIGNTIKALFYVDASGNQYPLTRKDIADLGDYSGLQSDPQHFYFEGDQVGLYPYPSAASGSLLFVFPRKVNQLKLTTECAKITAVSSDATHTTFTVDTDLTASLSVGSKIDIQRGQSPFLLWADYIELTDITTTTIQVLKSDIVDVAGTVEPEINDYIAPTGYSNIPMIPEEFQPVLSQMGAVRLLRSLGDLNKLNEAKSELKELRAEALDLIRNRAESAPDKIYKKNPLLRHFRG